MDRGDSSFSSLHNCNFYSPVKTAPKPRRSEGWHDDLFCGKLSPDQLEWGKTFLRDVELVEWRARHASHWWWRGGCYCYWRRWQMTLVWSWEGRELMRGLEWWYLDPGLWIITPTTWQGIRRYPSPPHTHQSQHQWISSQNKLLVMRFRVSINSIFQSCLSRGLES